MATFTRMFLDESAELVRRLDEASIEALAAGIASVRAAGGRLCSLGVGGSAGHAGHAVNDFRKLCGIEAYAPTDNVSELTARVNDEGWDTSFVEWLRVSRLGAKDVGAKIFGIVGRDGGFTKQAADACVVIPTVSPDRVTPHTEGFCAVVWHLLVSHPALQRSATKWESVK